MAYATFEKTMKVTSVDIDTMQKMSLDEYEEYLRSGLFYVDHHELLRSIPAGYPLATNKEQMKALLDYLQELAPEVG